MPKNIKLVSFKLCPYVQRAIITLEQKGVTYDVDYIDLDDPPAWFGAMSPSGKVPLLLVGEEVLFESGVIIDYLDEVFPPRLHPADPLRRAHHKAWIEFGSGLLAQLHALGVAPDAAEFERALTRLQTLLERFEVPLRQGVFGGAGAPTLVDAALAPFFMRLEIQAQIRREISAACPSRVAAWGRELLARPSVKRSVVDDFIPRYLHFLGQKGSWLAAQASVD